MSSSYKYWNREQLYEHMLPQCLDFGISTMILKQSVFDEEWNPRYDYNGCNIIQDAYHPFLPCFIHDYRWVANQGGLDSDIEFKINLIKSGFSNFKAWRYFIAVRIGWLFYYKWIK